jgi:RNA polymerase sigma factor (sigma-70 family)
MESLPASPAATRSRHPARVSERSVSEVLVAEVGALRALARGLVRDHETAADLVQETCVAALSARAPRGPTFGWLAAILRNAWRQHVRGAARRARREAGHAPCSGEAPATDELNGELALHRRLVELVASLPPGTRDVVLLRFWRGLDVREIAAVSGLHVATVQARLDRALVELRARLRSGADERVGRAVLASAALRPVRAAAVSSSLPLSAGVLLVKTWIPLAAVAAVLVVLAVIWSSPGNAPAPARPDAAGTAGAVAAAAAPDAADAARARVEVAAAALPTPAAARAPELTGAVRDVHGTGVADVDLVFAAEGPAGATGDAGGADAAVVARTAADGTFALPRPARAGWLTVRSATWAAIKRGHFRDTEAADGIVVLVAPARDYTGTVVDAQGQPVAGARVAIDVAADVVPVRAVGADAQALPSDLGAVDADGAGRFALRGVGFVDGARLVARHEPFAPAELPLPAWSSDDLVLRLGATKDEAKVVHGIVLDARGAPVEGAIVAAGGAAVRSARDGAFTAPWGWRRPGFVRAVATRLGAATARLEPGAGRPGWSAAHPLVVQFAAEPLAVAGRVVDASGAPVAGARVWTPDLTYLGVVTSSHDGHELSGEASVEELGAAVRQRLSVAATTDGRGVFTLPGMLPREYALFALDPATLRATGPVAAAPGHPCELRLDDEPRRAVGGVLVARDGTPLAGVAVHVGRTLRWQRPVRDPDPWEGCPMVAPDASALVPSQRAVTDAEGRFALPPLCVGGTYLLFRGDAVMFAPPVRLDDAGTPDALRVVVDARSRFRVVLASGSGADAFSLVGADGAHVTTLVRVESYEMSVGKVALANGVAPIAAAAAGEVTLVLWRGDAEVARHAVVLRPGGPHDVRL